MSDEQRPQQVQQTLSQALLVSLLRGGGPNQPGSSMPGLQLLARMSRDEERAYTLSKIELVLTMMSVLSDTDDVSVLVSPSSVVSASNNDDDSVQAQQQ
jgi:hypothetical protein